MVFKCQEDSFLQEFSSRISSCVEVSPGKFNVICEDTILFPEGGGQPWDTGIIDGRPVVSVHRKGTDAVHLVESTEPFADNQLVVQKLDWTRRFDHMQQHSGQHLLSALFEQEFTYKTLSWWLGTDTSYIELDAKCPITDTEIRQIEDRCNSLIRQALPVTVAVFESLAAITAEDVKRATRGLPADHEGQIRVINIEGVDSNMCCGTHVSNLAQLQAVKVLNLERPSKNKLILHFLVGDRILNRVQAMFERELKLNLVLKSGPTSHLDLTMKIQENVKRQTRALKVLSKEAALLEVETFKAKTPNQTYFFTKRMADECDSQEFSSVLTRELKTHFPSLRAVVVFITDKPTGQLLIICPDEDQLRELAAQMIEPLDMKVQGGAAGLVCKNGRFQAKFANEKGIKKCEQFLKETFKQ